MQSKIKNADATPLPPATVIFLIDKFSPSEVAFDFVPEPVYFACPDPGMEKNIMEDDKSSPFDKRGIQHEIPPDPAISVVSVYKEKIDFIPS